MARRETEGGVAYEPAILDRVERRFWRDIWDSVPATVAREHGIEREAFGDLQVIVAADLAAAPMLNMVLGAAELDDDDGSLAAAIDWARARGVSPMVPITPGLPGSEAVEGRLAAQSWEGGYAWMKFVRDAHPPRFQVAADVEVVEVEADSPEPFGMIAATGFGMPAWAAAFFAGLPGREGWRCYVARVDGEAGACGAMLIEGDVAEFGIGATLEPARRRGCQLALLSRRIEDAAAAGCRTLFVETGERVPDRPSASYRNILRAGFEEAYLRPNWRASPA
jgi:GNAT superfamily N-acetyltransferase